eukprot:302027_1
MLRFVWFIDDDYDADIEFQLINGVKCPKHTVGNFVVNCLREFVGLETSKQIYGWYTKKQFKYALKDTVELFEVPYFWSGTEQVPLWDPKTAPYPKLKKNWVLNDFYNECLFRAYLTNTEGLKCTVILEGNHSVIERMKRKTDKNVTLSKRMVDVMLADANYHFSHLQKIKSRNASLPA